jgi:hypothetical protein
MAEKLRCRIGRHHWIRTSVGGETFGECSDCKERDWDQFQGREGWDQYQEHHKPAKPLPWTGGGGGGG